MAIEDAPRLPTEHDEEVQVVQDAKPVVRESFVDWVRNRFQPGETPWGKLLAGEADNGNDEESDDTVEEESSIVAKKRPSFFKGLRALIIPSPEKLVDDREGDTNKENHGTGKYLAGDYPSGISSELGAAEESANQGQEDAGQQSWRSEVTGDLRGDVGPQEIDIDNAEADQDSPIYDRSGEAVLSSRDEAPTLVESPPPESIQSILQRQQRLQDELRVADAMGQSNATETPPIDSSVSADRYYTNAPSLEHQNTTAGLVALDVLNYGRLAKKRDKKNEKASIKRDKVLSKEQIETTAEVEKKLLSQDLYQKELAKRLERQELQQQERLPKVRNRESRQIITDERIKNNRIVDKIATNNKDPERQMNDLVNNHLLSVEAPEQKIPIVAAPDVMLPTADTILHKVEEAAEKNIPIETQYELRHETKGNQDFSVPADVFVAPQNNISTAHNQSQSSANQSLTDIATSRSSSGAEDYQKAAAAGTLGAIFGIVLFIILYVLSR